MTRNLFTSAMFAGVAAGLVVALLQFWLVIPLLIEGELYETGQRVHFAAGDGPQTYEPTAPTGISRALLTVGFNVISFTAFALILVAGMAYAERFGHKITGRSGIIWGLAGFIALHLSPAMGLPPELPGATAADLGPRQIWFLATVAASALGLGLIAFGQNAGLIAAGVAALAVPHIIGAPQPGTYLGAAPPELSALFAARSLGLAAVGWVTLGTVAAFFWARGRDT